jgi:argininosuccinate synthase
VAATSASPYSVDLNLWGRSVECGVLEDPWAEPPADVWEWTLPTDGVETDEREIAITFEHGVPVALDGETFEAVELVQRLNTLAGSYGVGRIDHVENRLVGIKSREVYEAPAAVALLMAHQALEELTLSRDQARVKALFTDEYARLVYNGQWYSALHADLLGYIGSTQRFVTGDVRLKLWHGTCRVVGRRSPYSLYSHALATYERGDAFNHASAIGFIELWGLPLKVQAQAQLLGGRGGAAGEFPGLAGASAPVEATLPQLAAAAEERPQ